MSTVARDIPELREILAQHILSDRSRKPKRAQRASGPVVEFLCPRPDHDDSTASAWLGEHAWGCSGCGAQGNLMDLVGTLGLDVTLGGSGRGYTLEDYAGEKGFSIPDLERWGLVTAPSPRGSDAVMIPYRDVDGNLLRRRMRVRSSPGKPNKFWEPMPGGASGSIPGLYGLWHLKGERTAGQAVLLVEGESDCHACWTAGILALGVPGADTWKREWAQHLRGRQVYVWEEPDQGGATLVRAIAADFPDACVVRVEGVKDPCKLRQQDPEHFKERMRTAMEEAQRIGTPKPPIAFDVLAGATLRRMAEDREQPLDVVPTCFPTWNRCCHGRGGRQGVAHGWYVIVGGKQGSMKTMLVQNLAVSGLYAGERVCIISMEMDQDENAVRILPIVSGEPVYELEHGEGFRRPTWERAARTMERVMDDTGGAIYVNRETIGSLEEIDAVMHHYATYAGCRTFVIDYLQLAWVKDAGNRIHEQMTEVSQTVRRTTHKLKLTTYALSQLTQEAARAKETPVAQNLLGGAQLAADASQVVVLDHSRVRRVRERVVIGDREVVQHTGAIESVLVLDKNRHGPSKVEIPFHFDPRTLRIEERKLLEGEEW